MEIISVPNEEVMGQVAADLIGAQVQKKPNAVLGLATGGTPVKTYQQLARRYRESRVDFSRVCAVNLDEYVGLPAGHPQSYARFMREMLFDHINISAANTHIPNGLAPDLPEECRRYDELVARLGGIDLQLLGIGRNGHIGFNEPADHFTRQTHCVRLSDSTREANRRFFDTLEQVPQEAITMGIGSIFAARHVLMLACGKEKSQILKAAFFGEVTPAVPASILQIHPCFTLIADEDALSLP